MKLSSDIKLKVCGMRDRENIDQLLTLHPDYMGLIFWEPSKRYVQNELNQKDTSVKKVGVFVNESIDVILDKIEKFDLQALQIHAVEPISYYKTLRERLHEKNANVEIIAAFSVDESFDFSSIEQYIEVCNFFLFDTKGKLPGGNGSTFSWSLLEQYPFEHPYFLSGGIGMEQIDELKQFFSSPHSKYCVAIDVNSKFEVKPGVKNIEQLKAFKESLY